jgi:hypothetical protein
MLRDIDKKLGLDEAISDCRSGEKSERITVIDPAGFQRLPGCSFAYWAGDTVVGSFSRFPSLESEATGLLAKRGVNTNDDFRFLRAWVEVPGRSDRWIPHAKGGKFQRYFADLYLVVDWLMAGLYLEAERKTERVYDRAIVPSKHLYFRPGITWSLRTKRKISFRAMPRGSIFGSKGPAIIQQNDDERKLLAILSVCNSSTFFKFIEVQLAAGDIRAGGAANSYEVGVVQSAPLPLLDDHSVDLLSSYAKFLWSAELKGDLSSEISHVFLLPAALLQDTSETNELTDLKEKVERIVADCFSMGCSPSKIDDDSKLNDPLNSEDDEDDDERETGSPILSWCIGVAFGRFDIRLATGEREVPPEPEPFDPLPAKSPGMLPDGDPPFHQNHGILVDDPGHPDDLLRLIEAVLERVNQPEPNDVRGWLRQEFFPLHLRQYSKGRRKAPIYWPVSTPSGRYTLWLYYPALTDQTLFTAANDFVEPKLEQTTRALLAQRTKPARSRQDERELEELETFEQELKDLRSELLRLAPGWKPNHDDGVQITAAPLWPLFRHAPWQKLLRETWEKLEAGEYDWAHLAMAYWPERVREKCRTDRSLAIAHDLEHLYEPPPETEAKPKRGRKPK